MVLNGVVAVCTYTQPSYCDVLFFRGMNSSEGIANNVKLFQGMFL